MREGLIPHSEFLTRKYKIDKLLEASGWKIVPFEEKKIRDYHKCAVKEFPTSSGPVDYALFDEGHPIAVVEAKKEALGVYSVLSQAQRYAKGINSGLKFGEYGVPFAYSSNGDETYYQDLRDPHSYSRKLAGFHTPEALREIYGDKQNKGLAWMAANSKPHPRARDYQVEATQAVENALRQKKRQMLLAMATGTGKTFTMAMQIYRLMKSGYAKRILFLVDRRALAAQAVRELATFEAEPGLKFNKIYEVYSQRFKREDFEDEKFDPTVLPTNYLTNPKPGQSFVYVCTIQRMRINLFGRGSVFEEETGDESDDLEADKLDIPIHAFDVVIADECHRGYTADEIGKWREVLDYFDSVKIGLTATPAAHTKAYFNDIVFRYDYQRAVKEGHLVDYDPITIKSSVKMNGIFLKKDELVGVVDTEAGFEKLDKIEDEREFESTKIEREITSPDSTKKILKEFAKYATEFEKTRGHFPKTLIFAVNDLPKTSHAERVVKECRELFGKGDSFVQKITGSPTVDRPLQKIREFRNRPEPAIVVTVDMLSTGVDIPAIENIIFMRPVKSRILFAQMLGRGTRRCDEIGKDRFYVFDCFGGSLLEYFDRATDFTIEPPDKPTRTVPEIIEDVYKNRDRKYNVGCLVKRLQRIAKNMSGEALDDFSPYITGGDIGKFATELPSRLDSDFAQTIQTLRDKGFQNALQNYTRRPKNFFIAYETQDDVSSEFMFKTSDGKELKSEDYIQAFERFVSENEDKIEALKILIKKPAGWNTSALHELRTSLAKAPYKFTEDNLKKAYHSELADIISIVKHAAKDEPLLSSRERVEKAIGRLTKGKKLNDEQKRWLELIKDHLVVNLAIDEKDMEYMPIFARQGGARKAKGIFEGKLSDFLQKINEEVAR